MITITNKRLKGYAILGESPFFTVKTLINSNYAYRFKKGELQLYTIEGRIGKKTVSIYKSIEQFMKNYEKKTEKKL